MIIAFKLARNGYYQGDPDRVLKARVDRVLMLAHYDHFNTVFEETYYQINKKGT